MLPREQLVPLITGGHGVRRPLGLRAAGHRQPRGRRLRHRRRRQRRRRHPRGGRRRPHRAARALRPRRRRPRSRPGSPPGSPSCSPTPAGPPRWVRPGASGCWPSSAGRRSPSRPSRSTPRVLAARGLTAPLVAFLAPAPAPVTERQRSPVRIRRCPATVRATPVARARSPALRHVTDPRGKGRAWSGVGAGSVGDVFRLLWRLPVPRTIPRSTSRRPRRRSLLSLLAGRSPPAAARSAPAGQRRLDARPAAAVAGHRHRRQRQGHPRRPARDDRVHVGHARPRCCSRSAPATRSKAVDSTSNYPEGAPTTDLSAFTPNAEAIAKYNPDLVVLSDDLNGIVDAPRRPEGAHAAARRPRRRSTTPTRSSRPWARRPGTPTRPPTSSSDMQDRIKAAVDLRPRRRRRARRSTTSSTRPSTPRRAARSSAASTRCSA